MEGEYEIQLQDDAVPVIHPPRRIPISVRKKLEDTLTELCKKGIIERVNEPTDWVNSIVVVEKPNKLRICLDPKQLN